MPSAELTCCFIQQIHFEHLLGYMCGEHNEKGKQIREEKHVNK